MPSTAKATGITSINWEPMLEPNIKGFQINIAEQALRSAVGSGFNTAPTVITDGVVNRDYHDVKAFGRIEFTRKNTSADAIRWIIAELKRLSPVGSAGDPHPGLYQRSHIIMIDGASATDADLDGLTSNAVVQIVNTQPYAGKIEGQDAYTRYETRFNKYARTGRAMALHRASARKKAGATRASLAGESPQAPRGVYRVVLAEAIQRFGKSVAISYAPVKLDLGVTVYGTGGGSRSRDASKSRKRQRVPQVYPCFTVVSKSLFV